MDFLRQVFGCGFNNAKTAKWKISLMKILFNVPKEIA
jgi:hypothetical protein